MPSHRSLHDVNTDSDSGRTTPQPASIQTNTFGTFTTSRVGNDHMFAKWQYKYGQHNDIEIFGISVSALRSLIPTAGELTRRTALPLSINIVHISVGTWIRNCFPQTVDNLIIVRFYIREVPLTKSVNIRVYVQIPLKVSYWSCNMGFDFITGRPAGQRLNVAWTSGMFEPVGLPGCLIRHKIVKVPWDGLQSFTWPGDDMD